MQRLSARLCAVLAATLLAPLAVAADDAGWEVLFDGSSLERWRASETPDCFRLADGILSTAGGRSHLFYETEQPYQDFELVVELMTTPGSNSGVFFHTAYQETGWPRQGYEAQVNTSHGDWRRTASIYGVSDVRETVVADNEWFTLRVKVEGKRIQTWVNETQMVDWTEPDDWAEKNPHKRLSSGTFALQGHDPKSVVHYRSIKVKRLN